MNIMRRECLDKLQRGHRYALQHVIKCVLNSHLRRLGAGAPRHAFLASGQRFPALCNRVTEASGQGQAMRFLKLLRGLDGFHGFPLTQPDLAAQIHSTSDDVDVVMGGVLVAHGNIGRALRESHALHEVGGDLVPLFGSQTLARRA